MRNANSGWLWALAALLLALFLWGAEQVAVMPMQTGEVYPPYSSLRADPLGAKALYESVASLPELEVSRRYKAQFTLEVDAALLDLGVEPAAWSPFVPEQTVSDYEHLLEKGGRVILGFLPSNHMDSDSAENESDKNEARRVVPLKDRWGIQLVYHQPPRSEDSGALPRVSAFTLDPGPAWTVLARRAGLPTAAERPLGAGTLVLITDTYPLSNEGLRDARNPELIARLLGNAHRIVFDEQHLGVAEEDGVAVLVRKYRLQGSLLVLLIAVALFMWSSGSSLLPPRKVRLDDAVAGRDSQEGLATLLRRGIAERDLMDTCFREWSRSAPPARLAQAVEAEIAQRHGRNPVEAYQAAQKTIAEKR